MLKKPITNTKNVQYSQKNKYLDFFSILHYKFPLNLSYSLQLSWENFLVFCVPDYKMYQIFFFHGKKYYCRDFDVA